MTKNVEPYSWIDDQGPRTTYQSSQMTKTQNFPIVASTTSGYAPLPVHFATTLFAGSSTENRYKTLYYAWAFGDPSSGTWTTTGLSKNVGYGPCTAHLFEGDGQFLVALVVMDDTGVIGVASETINVSTQDSAFPGDKTTCINIAGDDDFSGAPAGANTVEAATWDDVIAEITDDQRIMIKDIASWTTTNKPAISASDNFLITTYGGSAKPVITHNGSGSSSFLNISAKTNARILNLDIRDGGSASGFCFFGSSATKNILIAGCNFDGWPGDVNLSSTVQTTGDYIDNFWIYECIGDNHGGNAWFIGGERTVCLGNDIKRSTNSHLIRIWHGYESTYQHNLFSGASVADTGSHQVKMHCVEQAEVNFIPQAGNKEVRFNTNFNNFSHNIVGGGCPWMVAIGPQNGVQPELMFNTIVENNTVIEEYGVRSQQRSTRGFIIWADDTAFRCNAIDLTDSQDANISFVDFDVRGVEGPHTRNDSYHNSFYVNVQERTHAVRGTDISDANVSDTNVANNYLVVVNTNGNAITNVDDDGTNTNIVGSTNVTSSSTDDAANANLEDPDNPDPLLRSYKPVAGPAIGAGQFVDVFKDILDVTIDPLDVDSSAYVA